MLLFETYIDNRWLKVKKSCVKSSYFDESMRIAYLKSNSMSSPIENKVLFPSAKRVRLAHINNISFAKAFLVRQRSLDLQYVQGDNFISRV